MTAAARAAPSTSPPPRRPLARLWRRLRGGELSRGRASASVAVGLFIGCLPLYGLHLPLCLAVCLPLRLDAVTAYIAANISNPLMAPFLVAGEIEIGSLLLDGHFADIDTDELTAARVSDFAAQLALGSVVMGALLASLGALTAWTLVGNRAASAPSALELAIQRTIARFAGARRGDRYYVAAKLHADPVVEQISSEAGDFGRVVDVGCGRGQLGLVLVELGRARTLSGFDADERKIAAARLAAGSDASFEVGDLSDTEIPSADTLLLIDVLHYLKPDGQSRLLERAAHRLEPGGRLFVRELDAARRARAWPAIFAELLARAIGYNRGSALSFATIDDVVSQLTRLGLSCRVDRSGGLSNVLVIAERPLTAS